MPIFVDQLFPALVDHFDDAMRTRLDEHWPVVDDGVAIVVDAIFPGDLVTRARFGAEYLGRKRNGAAPRRLFAP